MNKPTYEDMIKYASQKAKVLLNLDYFSAPFETVIKDTMNDGELFKYNVGNVFCSQDNWAKTIDAEILAMLPTEGLMHRLAEIEAAESMAKQKAKQTTDQKEIQQQIDNVQVLTFGELEKVWKELSPVEEKLMQDIKKTIKKQKRARKKKNTEQTGE